MTKVYHPKEYWENRFCNKLDLTTVGHLGLGYVYNHWLYKARFNAAHRALRKLNLDVSGNSLIDIGVGSGAWVPFWQKCGISKLVGLDITASSTRILKNKYPEFEFIEGDISSALPFKKNITFDIATAFDILFHITNDIFFAKAIANISKCVKKGGVVLISDSFCRSPWGPFYHEYHRSYDTYIKELKINKLKAVHIEPIFITMTKATCDSNSRYRRILDQFTKNTLRIVNTLSSSNQTEIINHTIGCSLYLLDLIICQIVKTGPSLKILFAQKC